MRKLFQSAIAAAAALVLTLLPFAASAQTTITGGVVVTGGGQTGNNLATYSHPGSVAGGVCYVNAYTIQTDAFAAINACTAQLPAAGGTIDATALGTANYTVTTPLTALNQPSPSSVTLLMNSGTTFTMNQVLGTTKSPANCAVPVGGYPGSGSSIVVPGHSKFAGNFLLGPSFVGWGGICNGNFTGTQESLLLDGVTIQGNSSATVAGALFYIAGVFVPTRVTNSGTYQCFSQCLEVEPASGGSSSAAGNIMFDNDLFTDGYSGSATYPGSVVKIDALTAQGEVTNILFLGGAIQDNGPHNPLLVINGRGGGQTGAISILNTYFETAAASPSSFWTNVDPVQFADAGQIVIDPMRVQGAINSSSQANLVDITGTTGVNASFGINLNQVSVFTAAGFTRLVNNTIEGTAETGFPNGLGDTAIANYQFGLSVPQIRQTNVAPPTTIGVCTIGNLWTNSTAASAAATVSVCAGTLGSQTYQALGGGSGGSGVVNNGAAYQVGAYPAAGSTIGGAPGLFSLTPTMTQAQINSLFSSLSSSGGTVLVPDGVPQTTFTNTSVGTKDLRKFADYLQITRYGLACDAQSFSVTLTAGSNQVNVGALAGGAGFVGRTLTAATQTGYLYNSPQYSWTPTITAYANPFFTLSSNAPFNFSGVVQIGTLNTTAIQSALNDANQVFPLSIPSGCKMLTDTLHWNKAQSIVGRQMSASGFVGMPGHSILIQPDYAAISAWSITSNIATFQTPTGNDFVPGDPVILSGFGTSTFFNNQILNVLSTGLSPTQFQLQVGHANGSATESGKAGPVFGATGAGATLSNIGFTLDQGIDPAQVTGGTWTSYDANANPTVQTPVYEPLFDHSPLAAAPLAPGWITGGVNGVAVTAQNSAVICTPNAETPPVVGQLIMFPYFSTVFTATVSSTAGSCSSGFTARTMSAALPNTAGYNQAQAEWFTGSAIQSTTTAIPTTITYPLVLTLTLSTAPVPGFESNFPSHGHIKVCGIEADYMGVTQTSPYTITLRRGPATSPGCSGTTPIAVMNPCPAKNLFGSNSDQPWPVIPSINSGDSTPSGANWFPGECGGAAAIGFPVANGNVAGKAGLFNSYLTDLEFDEVGPQGTNQGMAYYSAGNAQSYSTEFNGFKVNYLWGGFMQGPASSGQHGIGPAGPTGVGNTLHNLSIHAAFPFSFVDFQQSKLDRIDTYSTEYSPFDGTAVGVATCLHFGYTLDEQTGAVITLAGQDKTTVWNCEPENGSHIERNPYLVSDGPNMTFDTDTFEGFPLYFGGSAQTVTNTQFSYPAFNYGADNTFDNLIGTNTSGYATNVFNGQGQFYNWGPNTKCSVAAGGYGPSVACGPGTVQPYSGHTIESSVTGNHSYQNSLGGMINPAEWDTQSNLDVGPMSVGYTIDPTEDFWGAYSACNLGGGASCQSAHMDGLNGYIFIGPQNRITDGPYVLDAHFKSASASSSFALNIAVEDSGTGQCASPGGLLSQTVTTTTSWQTVKFPVDFTGKAGCVLQVFFNSGATTDQIRVGKFNFVPVPGQVLLPTATPTIGATCAGPNAIIGSNSSTPLYCLNNLVVGGGGGGGSGITALTGDVTASGTGSVAATVRAIGGGTALSTFTGILQNTAGVVTQATNAVLSGYVQAGTSTLSGVNSVASSATPVFDLSLGDTQLIILGTNVTSSSVINGPTVNLTQHVRFIICQDATGGRTFAWPAAFQGVTPVTLTASGCTSEFFNVANTIALGTQIIADNYNSQFGNSSVSPSAEGAAYRGFFAIPTGTNPTLTVNTTAVGAQSVILLQADQSIGAALNPTVTCNTSAPSELVVTARTPGTGFVAEAAGTVTTNPVCVSFTVVNP